MSRRDESGSTSSDSGSTFSSGRPRAVAASLALLLLGFSCAAPPKAPPFSRSRDIAVLLPDDRGKTGAIVVSSAGVDRLLSEPRQAVEVSAGAGPGTPFVLSRKDVGLLAGPAMAALPPRPMTFIFHFENDDAVLTGASLVEMQKAIRIIEKRGPIEICVVGHTDTMGSRDYNYRLGLKRARTAATFLAQAGIKPSIIETVSHGEGNLLVPTGDEVPEPRNRRVELTVR